MTTPDPSSLPAPFGPYLVVRSPRLVVFGLGQRQMAATAIAELGSEVLICTDERLGQDPETTALVAALRQAGCSPTVYSGTQADLPTGGIADFVAGFDQARPDVIVGFGGGSCLDMAKVVSVLLTHGGQVQDYYGEFNVPGPIIPVVAIPTTAGTGSEVTPVAVVSDPGRAMKVGISSPHLIPEIAICDPELTYGCPGGLTASAGADALTHCIESYTAIRRDGAVGLSSERVFVGKNEGADNYGRRGVELLARSLRASYAHGDAAAREDVMLAALYGGYALGTAGTAAAHALQYPVGALTHTPHGVGVGTLLPYVMEFNRPVRVTEFAELARAFAVGSGVGSGGSGGSGAIDVNRSDDELSHQVIDLVADLLAEIDIPPTLAALGLAESDCDRVGELGAQAARLVQNNPRPLDVDALQAITRAAFTGDRAALRD